MSESFVENYKAYCVMAQRGDLDDFPPSEFVSPMDCYVLQALLGALGPIEAFIRLAEGEKYVTIAVIPVRLSAAAPTPSAQSPNGATGASSALSRPIERREQRSVNG